MSTIYSQHTVESVFVGPTGHTHNRAADDGAPFALDCAACEPFLVKEGWVYNTELVPLTDVQEREKERVTREGNIAIHQVATALADAAAGALLAGDKPKRTMTDDQKQKIAAGRARAAAEKAKAGAGA